MDTKISENDRERKTYTIRELCREFGTTTRTLRFYEDKGILFPARRGTSRIYSSRDRARLLLALQGKRIGLRLEKIAELLNLYDLKGGKIKQIEEAILIFKAQIKSLEQQKIDLEETINDLIAQTKRVEDELDIVRKTQPETISKEE